MLTCFISRTEHCNTFSDPIAHIVFINTIILDFKKITVLVPFHGVKFPKIWLLQLAFNILLKKKTFPKMKYLK